MVNGNIPSKFNNLTLGVVVGLIVPIIAFFLFYYSNIERHVSFNYFMDVMIEGAVLSKMLSLCVIPNLVPFFIGIWLNLLKSARGVLFSTIFLAVTSVVLTFIL